MAFTRAQASDLLNKTEMRLFDDSRANALRGLDREALASRIRRARDSRDRARDLLKRQRIAARKTGPRGRDGVAERTARKEELLVEILARFTEAHKGTAPAGKGATKKGTKKAAKVASKKVAKTSSARKPAAGGTATKKSTKAATRKSPARGSATGSASVSGGGRPASKQASTKNAAAKKAPAKKTPAKKAPAKKVAAKGASAEKSSTRKATEKAPTKNATSKSAGTKATAGRTRSRAPSPERALENTRKLLEAKQQRDREPQPWQTLDPTTNHVPQPGYQSPEAASKALELHQGEARLQSIHGSISTHDRRNQGKRDHRGDND